MCCCAYAVLNLRLFTGTEALVCLCRLQLEKVILGILCCLESECYVGVCR